MKFFLIFLVNILLLEAIKCHIQVIKYERNSNLTLISQLIHKEQEPLNAGNKLKASKNVFRKDRKLDVLAKTFTVYLWER